MFVIFYGLTSVATVPPIIVLSRRYFSDQAPVVFSWVFAAHQIGAAPAAAGAGWLGDHQGYYDMAFQLSVDLCATGTLLCFSVPKPQVTIA